MNKKLLLILISILVFLSSEKTFSQQELFEKIKRMTDSVSVEKLSEYIKDLQNASGHFSRVNFTPGNDSAVIYIKKEFEKNKNLSSVKLDTFYISSAKSPYNQKPLFNVIAEIKGKLEGTYIISAHLDCSASHMNSWDSQWETIKAPGADDNATGIAALLEIAGIMSDTLFNYKPDYNIKLIAFGAEEYGPAYDSHHHGSKHFAGNAKAKGENILGVINLDMFGYNQNYDYTAIVSNTNSKILGEKFIDAKNLYGIDLLTNSSPLDYATYSDHASFWDEGYKAILIEENAPPWNNSQYFNANPYYHSSSDTFETVNMSLVKKVTQVCLAEAASFAGRLTDVKNDVQNIPKDFNLSQNYPNPFNPTTKIKYTIAPPNLPTCGRPKGEALGNSMGLLRVTLKVYDILGNEVATLVNKQQSSGNYEVEFDAVNPANGTGLASGVYFYKLEVGVFVKTKKMVLIR